MARRVWLITYGSSSKSITPEICSECGIEIDECYTLTQRDLKYTIIHTIPNKKSLFQIQKVLKEAKRLYDINASNIFGYDPVTANDCNLQDHPGMKLMIKCMNENDERFESWLLNGDLHLSLIHI